jgi:hypothetical protein
MYFLFLIIYIFNIFICSRFIIYLIGRFTVDYQFPFVHLLSNLFNIPFNYRIQTIKYQINDDETTEDTEEEEVDEDEEDVEEEDVEEEDEKEVDEDEEDEDEEDEEEEDVEEEDEEEEDVDEDVEEEDVEEEENEEEEVEANDVVNNCVKEEYNYNTESITNIMNNKSALTNSEIRCLLDEGLD